MRVGPQARFAAVQSSETSIEDSTSMPRSRGRGCCEEACEEGRGGAASSFKPDRRDARLCPCSTATHSVFASLSQTTLLRSYTIDTMNDNTNILLGGGELLLTHTEDEARFQITPGSYLLILEIVSRKKGGKRAQKARVAVLGTDKAEAVAAHKLYCETDAEPAKEVKEYAASSLQKYTNLVSKALPRREPDEVNGAEEVLITSDVDRPDGAGELGQSGVPLRDVDNAKSPDQLHKLNVEKLRHKLGAAGYLAESVAKVCANADMLEYLSLKEFETAHGQGLSETEIRALAAAGVAEARNSFEGAVGEVPGVSAVSAPSGVAREVPLISSRDRDLDRDRNLAPGPTTGPVPGPWPKAKR